MREWGSYLGIGERQPSPLGCTNVTVMTLAS
jgi:hypothetical protein